MSRYSALSPAATARVGVQRFVIRYDGPSLLYDVLSPATAVHRRRTTARRLQVQLLIDVRRFVGAGYRRGRPTTLGVAVRRFAVCRYGSSSLEIERRSTTTNRRPGIQHAVDLQRLAVCGYIPPSRYNDASSGDTKRNRNTAVRSLRIQVAFAEERLTVHVRRFIVSGDSSPSRYGGSSSVDAK